MRQWKSTAMLTLSVALLAGMTPLAFAQTGAQEDRTIVKLTERMQIPGRVLEPGTYVFRAMNIDTSKDQAVRIFNGDESQQIASVQAIDGHMVPAPQTTVFVVHPASGDQPMALKEWYTPAEQVGWAFVYPREIADQLRARGEEQIFEVSSNGQLVAHNAEAGGSGTGSTAAMGSSSGSSDSTMGSTTGTTGSTGDTSGSSSSTTGSSTSGSAGTADTSVSERGADGSGTLTPEGTADRPEPYAQDQPTQEAGDTSGRSGTAQQGVYDDRPDTGTMSDDPAWSDRSDSTGGSSQSATSGSSGTTGSGTTASGSDRSASSYTAVNSDDNDQSDTSASSSRSSATADERTGAAGEGESLPRTASSVSILGLIGLLALGAGIALWKFSR
ncbi:MAG: hypothetical protein KBD01_04685 [Acidobacteria bacterium]|nr:hypothetical protein [Acidobacteriota bacterium]